MQRTLLLIAALLAIGMVDLPAQQLSNDANPLNRNFSIHLGGVIVPPISGKPFSATAIIELQQVMTDGSVVTSRAINFIGRDSEGRTHGEMRPWGPVDFRGIQPLNEVHIFDPQTLVKTIYTPATHIATQEVLQLEVLKNSNPSSASDSLVKVEDLGSNVIEGIDVKGTRRARTIPAQGNGTEAALTVVDEFWYSEDLHVNLSSRHNDPRIGVQTIKLTDIKREDPEPSFFEVPNGYKIVDLTPTADSPAARRTTGVAASSTQ